MIFWGKWLSCSYVNSQTTRKLCGTKLPQHLRCILSCKCGGLLSLAGCIWQHYLWIILFDFCPSLSSSSEKLGFPISSSQQLKMSSILIYLCQHSTFLLTEIFFNIDHCLLLSGSCSSKGPQYSCVFDSLNLILSSARSNSWFIWEFRLLIPGPVSDLFMWVACVLKGWALHFSSQVTCGPLESQKFSTWQKKGTSEALL